MEKMVRIPKDLAAFAKKSKRKVVAMRVTTPFDSVMEMVGSVRAEDAAEACRLFSKLNKLCEKT